MTTEDAVDELGWDTLFLYLITWSSIINSIIVMILTYIYYKDQQQGQKQPSFSTLGSRLRSETMKKRSLDAIGDEHYKQKNKIIPPVKQKTFFF